MSSGISDSDHAPELTARSNRRIAALTLVALVGVLAVVAIATGWLEMMAVKTGFGVATSLAVGLVVVLALIAFTAGGRRRDNDASRSATLCAGAVITSVCIATTAAAIGSNAAVSVALGIPLALVIIVCGAIAARRAHPSVFGIPRAAYLAAALVAAPLTGGWIWYMFAGPGYYSEFNHIKTRLAAIPGVQVLDIRGNRDLTYEDIFARLRVDGKGEIVLMSLTRASFNNSADLHISKIGPYSFRSDRWGYGAVIDREGKPVWHQSIGFTLNVGSRGDFSPGGRLAGRLKARINNVQELIQHYDQIIAMIELMKREKNFFRDEDGSTFEYVIRS